MERVVGGEADGDQSEATVKRLPARAPGTLAIESTCQVLSGSWATAVNRAKSCPRDAQDPAQETQR